MLLYCSLYMLNEKRVIDSSILFNKNTRVFYRLLADILSEYREEHPLLAGFLGVKLSQAAEKRIVVETEILLKVIQSGVSLAQRRGLTIPDNRTKRRD